MKLIRRTILAAVSASALVTLPMAAAAQELPRNVRLVIGSDSTGGDTYQNSAIVADALSEHLGINVKVDAVGASEAFKALERDSRGTTLMIFHDQSYLANLYGVRGYEDPFENYKIGPTVAINPGNAYLVAKDSPYQSMEDILTAAENGERVRVAIQPGGVSEIGFSAMKNAASIRAPGSEENVVAVNTGSQSDKNQAMWDDLADVINGSLQANEQFTQLPEDDLKAMKFVWVTARPETLMGIFSGFLGIFVSLIGVYDVSEGGNGETRLVPPALEYWLEGGFSLLPVLIGLFGLAAILEEAEIGVPKSLSAADVRIGARSTFSFSIFRGQIANLVRSSGIGTFVGILPGVGGSAASILSYSAAKSFSKTPERFGKGEPAGIIASESGNNGLTGGALVPLLSLGIPGDSTTALLIGAFTLQGIRVGPLFIGNNPTTWEAMIVAMIVANIVMFGLMYFAIRHVARIVTVPKEVLYPIILMMCVIGAYTINYGIMFDVWTLLIFGLFGWLAVKLKLEGAPFIIGFVLGPAAELYFVKSLESFGYVSVFFTKSWIAVGLWVLIVASIAGSIALSRRSSAAESAG